VKERKEVSPTENLGADRGRTICSTDIGTKSVKPFLVFIN
jgi:hypothetical protein